MIFITNKYTDWYFSIIKNAKSRISEPTKHETHHIIPRSLGGTNESSNLVTLTCKEHLIAHKLLTKMTIGESKSKMTYALNMMTNFSKYNAKNYQKIKNEFTELHSIKMSGENHPNYGKKQSQATINKRLANTNRNLLKSQLGKLGPEHPSYGIPLREETKLKISTSSTGHKKPPGFGKGENNSNYGKKHPGLNSGENNPMFGKRGETNPNFGKKYSNERVYKSKIAKIGKNIEIYVNIVNRLHLGESAKKINSDTGISLYVIYQIQKKSHVVYQYIEKNNAI